MKKKPTVKKVFTVSRQEVKQRGLNIFKTFRYRIKLHFYCMMA